MMDRQKRLILTVILSGLIIFSLVGISIFLLNSSNKTEEDLFPLEKALSIISVNSSSQLFRGEKLRLDIKINVTKYNVTIVDIVIEMARGERISHALQTVNQTYSPGIHVFQVVFLPGIWAYEDDLFFALSDGNYLLQRVNSTFMVEGQTIHAGISINQTLTVQNIPEVNMFEGTDWNLVSDKIAITQDEGDYLSLETSASSFSNATVWNEIDLTGAYDFQLLASNNFSGVLKIGSSKFQLFGTEIHLNLANIIGFQNISLSFNASFNEMAFNFTLLNQRKVLLVGIADDHWSDTFPSHQEILDEVNTRFEKWFNVSFLASIILPVDYQGSTFLPSAFDFTIKEFGSRLHLPGEEWSHQRGRALNNMGLDILLFNTNKTMSNYGMVIGDAIGGFNMAANAGGSLNANGFRLQPSWADNLFQHELSHIFGAPDRYSGEDDPSIMTKSDTLEDLLNDLANGTLWLELTNWLDEDLLTMSSQFVYYEDYYGL
ncbi:MAG: hypothetical protein D6732_22295 [Methanobacteriota archaeon]|nr:MAG: hypothetical protein D6732_22295 [Euryarchaeota archaeon]